MDDVGVRSQQRTVSVLWVAKSDLEIPGKTMAARERP